MKLPQKWEDASIGEFDGVVWFRKKVTIPAENMGDIAGDMASKRGRVIGQDMLPGNYIVVKAQVPLSEVTQYNSQLKSVTGGRGSYSMTLSHYEIVPPNVQQQIMAQYKAADEEE